MDSAIQNLKKEGFISIWSYSENQRNYPGWNIAIDDLGFKFLTALLALMHNSQWPSKKTFKIDQPTKNILATVNNLQGKAKWISPRELVLHFVKNSIDLDQWRINCSNDILTIAMGNKKLLELQECLTKTQTVKGDFAMSDSQAENILYFWPFS